MIISKTVVRPATGDIVESLVGVNLSTEGKHVHLTAGSDRNIIGVKDRVYNNVNLYLDANEAKNLALELLTLSVQLENNNV